MKKLFKKTTSTILALAVSFQTASINITNAIKANAENTNPTYTVYGDLNSDKEIDVFDLVHMRKNIQAEHASDSLDLNLDEVIDEDDLLELQDYSLGVSTFFAAYMSDDADNDGLCDAIELSTTKSNPNSEDTDGDGLTDYEEVFLTLTSPVEKYTINSKLSDSQADSDNDKITNIDEITTYKTNPILDDTDEDGINDYDEIFTHKTKPLVTDTDEDGIDDYSELQLNLNPLLSKTHGDVLDSEYKIEQSISATSKVFNDINDINTEDSPYKMSIEINTNGYAEKELSVTESGYSHMIDSDAVIGSIVEISASEFCNPASLTIKYTVADKYKECALEEYENIPELNGINNLCIFKYFEEINMLLPVETLFSGNTVYTVTDELGTYCLVDLSKWFDSLNISPTKIIYDMNNPTDYSSQISLANEEIDIQTDLGSNSTESNKSTKPIDIVFLLQIDNSEDIQTDAFYKDVYLIENFSKYVFDNFCDARVYIIKFSYNNGIIPETVVEQPNFKDLYASNKDELNDILHPEYPYFTIRMTYPISPFTLGLYDRNIAPSVDPTIELRDNAYIYQFINNSYESSETEVDFCLNNTGIFSLISDKEFNSYTEETFKKEKIKKVFEKAIEEKHGLYIPNFLENPSNNKTDEELTDDTLKKIIYHFIKEVFYKYDVLINNTPTSLVLEYELNANNGADTDRDGISDWEEFNTEFLNISDDGTAIPCTFEEIIAKGYAGDYLANAGGNSTARQQMFNSLHDKKMYVMKSDPTKDDSDMDGIPDKDDPMPLKKGLKPFGTHEYENEVNSKAETLYNDSLDSGTTPDSQTLKYDLPTEYLNVNDMVSLKQTILKFGKEKALSRAAIGIMMKDVNDNQDYLQYISDEDWLKFCEFFNKHVIGYGSVNEDIHYFRLKLNRTPDSFEELVDNSDHWYLYDKDHTAYHMNNGSFKSSNPNYPSCYNLVNNEYNMKFVDRYGMNEVVVTPKDINADLTLAENWLILTESYVKAATNSNLKYDPINVGTYNYSAYDFEYINLDGSKKKTSASEHNKYDVHPYLGGKSIYNNWGNVPGMIYRNTKKARDKNYEDYRTQANESVYNYWEEIFQ